MAARIETRVSLSEDRARRLRELARAQAVSEDHLVERALDILFSLTENLDAASERSGRSAMSEGALSRVWDNDDDARYDSWREGSSSRLVPSASATCRRSTSGYERP